MKRLCLPVMVAACLLLGGCSLLERSYSVVEPHSQKYWENEADTTLRAENYQDVVNDLLILVGRHAESAVIRLYSYEDDMTVAEMLDAAASEVQQETPIGSYAVEYITSSSQAVRGYYEISVALRYRRTAEQMQSVVNATSTEALPELLQAALKEGKTSLAVRIGYFQEEQAEVDALVTAAREAAGLTETPPWSVSYYPAVGRVVLIEFDWSEETLAANAQGALAEEQANADEVFSEKRIVPH